MSDQPLSQPFSTHEVLNQPPPLEGWNTFTSTRPLVEAVERDGAGWVKDEATRVGAIAGGIGQQWGALANEYVPKLRTHDRYGNRLDEVEYHPSWHDLLRTSVAAGAHASPWTETRKGAHIARAAMFITMSQAEAGHMCPISMTYAAVAALKTTPTVAEVWVPRLASRQYDGRFLPSGQKTGALAGMSMTEKQGGSDVRANTTVARPIGAAGPGEAYLLRGHKFFCSAPMCDAFLVLAQAPKGLSCFLVPRFLPDGTKNRFFIQRLKDKLGNRSNASSEIEFDATWCQMIGEEGRGVPTIIEMVNHTRLDCVLGSAGGMRYAVAQALHHVSNRAAFGKRLVEQPLMQNVLADLAIESEAATVVAMRLARAYDDASRGDVREQAFRRLATAVSKYWICKRAPTHAFEALECLGGSGYVEDSGLPRWYREAPVNSVWEGSGNVICLDVLRALSKEPEVLPAFLAELDTSASEPRLGRYIDSIHRDLKEGGAIEPRARRIVEKLALALQGALLLRYSPSPVAEAFVASRLAGDAGHTFGTLPNGVDVAAIIERHRPV